MKKKRWITLIILITIVWTWATYFLFFKQTCQDFIDECYKKNYEFWVRGWHIVKLYSDWNTSVDDKANCPQNCSRYTEERWYFKDKEKQKEYYNNKVAECKKEYEECLQNTTWLQQFEECHDCNKYWDPIYYRN